MLRKFSVRNFRCLRELDIEPLARVNLIVGANNVGKTALLEALYLYFASGRPEAPLRVNHSRGARGEDADVWEELGWLFHAKQTDTPIELLSENGHGQQSALRIRLVEPVERRLSTAETDGALWTGAHLLTAAARTTDLTIEYTDHNGKVDSSRAQLTPEGITVSAPDLRPAGNVVLVLKSPRFSEEHANRYSALAVAGREEELLPSLQALDPRIRRLKLLHPANKPLLYVDAGNGQLTPLTYMGEGLGYVLSWQLSILTTENGTVLIDEIEYGLHYSALIDAWKAVGTAARESRVQVFATTHSWECVIAAQNAFAESGDDEFRLHRLERRDGEVVALTYDQEQLATSVEFGFEVR